MFDTKAVEKIKTNLFSKTFFLNRAIHEIMWKNFCRAGHFTNQSMAHAHDKLDT